jgi:hypothetical protein
MAQATAPSIFDDLKIPPPERVPVWAVGLPSVDSGGPDPAQNVLSERHDLHVRWLATGALSAEVIQAQYWERRRRLPVRARPGIAMGRPVVIADAVENQRFPANPVATRIDATEPKEASGLSDQFKVLVEGRILAASSHGGRVASS